MAIKVKAVERKLKFTKNENDPGVYPMCSCSASARSTINSAAVRP